jgi:hypothetical protein
MYVMYVIEPSRSIIDVLSAPVAGAWLEVRPRVRPMSKGSLEEGMLSPRVIGTQ